MALSLDNSVITGNGFSSATPSLALSTSNPDDIILAFVVTVRAFFTPATVNSITGGGLTFTKRTAIGGNSGSTNYSLEIWAAPAASALSAATLQANLSAASEGLLAFVAFSGGNTSSIWDANGSLPASAGPMTSAPSVSGVSTSNANDVIIAAAAGIGMVIGNPGAGYTIIGNDVRSGVYALDIQYKIVAAVQSSVTVAFGASETSSGANIYADAIQAGSTISRLPLGYFDSIERRRVAVAN